MTTYNHKLAKILYKSALRQMDLAFAREIYMEAKAKGYDLDK